MNEGGMAVEALGPDPRGHISYSHAYIHRYQYPRYLRVRQDEGVPRGRQPEVDRVVLHRYRRAVLLHLGEGLLDGSVACIVHDEHPPD